MRKRKDGEPPVDPPDENALQASKLNLAESASGFELRLDLNNRSGRTLHAVAEPRGIRFDRNTRTLQVLMTDSELDDERIGFTTVLPKLIQVEPGGTKSLRIPIPRQITRMVMSASGSVPELERVSLEEADNIEVKIGWSTTPLYLDPRERGKPQSPLKAWEENVCVAREPRRRESGQR